MTATSLTTPECIALLKKHDTPLIIFLHTRKVLAIALFLANRLQAAGITVDTDVVRVAALLHDIKKFHELEKKCGWHSVEGAKLLEEMGYPQIAHIITVHELFALKDKQALERWEEAIVFYADKRVNHDHIVSVQARMEYVIKRYGDTAQKAENIKSMKDALLRLEARIFKQIGLSPEDINEKSVEPYLIAEQY